MFGPPIQPSKYGIRSPPQKRDSSLDPTPSKRRREMRSSDETGGVMSIEEYIHRCDAYRFSTLVNPFPLPVKEYVLLAVHEDFSALNALFPHVKDILTQHGIRPDTYAIYPVVIDKPGYDVPKTFNPALFLSRLNKPVKYVRIRMDHEQTGSSIWKNAAKACREYLVTQGQDYQVDIFSAHRAYQPSLFPISNIHPDIALWNQVRDRVTNYLDEKLANTWNVNCIWKFGNTEFEADNAVVIYVDVRTKCDWKILATSMHSIIRAELARLEQVSPEGLEQVRPEGLGQEDWDVEFLPGSFHIGASGDATQQELSIQTPAVPPTGMPGIDFKDMITDQPYSGTSIGIKGKSDGGTARGFVTLQVGSKQHHCALTNFYVVRAFQEDVPVDIYLRAETHGSDYFDDADQTKSDIQWLAGKDATATKDAYEKYVKNREQELLMLQKELEMMGGSHRGRETRIERVKNILAQRSYQKALISSLPLTLGKVLVSSGKHVSPALKESLFDWALVELDERWNGLQTIPPLAAELSRDAQPAFFSVELDLDYLPGIGSDAKSTDFSDVKCGDWYVKRGRTTDITAGICNGTEAYINCAPNDQKSYNESNQPADDRKHGRYMEFVIIRKDKWSRIIKEGSGIPQDVITQKSFCAAGDSGSFVWDINGAVAGLLYGQVTGKCGPSQALLETEGSSNIYEGAAGLVAPMPAVLADIARKTTFGEGAELIQGVLSLP